MKTVLSLDHISTITSINSLCPITLIDIPVSTNDNVQLLYIGQTPTSMVTRFPLGASRLKLPTLTDNLDKSLNIASCILQRANTCPAYAQSSSVRAATVIATSD